MLIGGSTEPNKALFVLQSHWQIPIGMDGSPEKMGQTTCQVVVYAMISRIPSMPTGAGCPSAVFLFGLIPR